MSKNIPLHKLSEHSETGFEIRHFLKGVNEEGFEVHHFLKRVDEEEPEEFYAHRDDNYFFILTERGHASMNVDFKVMKFVERDIYFVAPGQVHYDVRADECDYWYISVAPSLIPKEYLEVFQNASPFQIPYTMNTDEFKQCLAIIQLLAVQVAGDPDAVYFRQMIQELLQTFLCAVARQYVKSNIANSNAALRPQQITRDFTKLVKKHILSEKRPSRYAEMLNISETYLNEAIKKATGFTAGYWIRNNIVLEAKRLLFHTEMNVKEIAHALGYEDHTYFSKLFRQTTGITPLTFRAKYLK